MKKPLIKNFICMIHLICKSMKKNTLEKIENILLNGGDELEVDDE